MTTEKMIRAYLKDALSWQEAHIDFEHAVAELPMDYRGKKPEGFPYSIWQLVEHIRIAQWDILDFTRNSDYKERSWPDDYWPEHHAPENDDEWERAITAMRADREKFIKLLDDPGVDLFKPFEHGTGQTLFRQAMLIADHNAYHVGQIILIRKILEKTV
jgi:uncharacterized damage-inducible protein DinB